MSWLFSATGARILAGFFVMTLVARHFGPTQFGEFSYAVALFSLFEVFISIIHNSIIKKWIIEKKSSDATIMGSASATYFVMWLTIFSILMVMLWGFDFEVGVKRQILTLLLIGFFFRIFDIFVHWLDAYSLTRVHARIEIFSICSFSFLRLAIVFLNLDLVYLAVSIVIQALLNFFVLYGAYRKRGPPLREWRVSWPLSLQMLRNSFPLFVTSLALIAYNKIDQIMIGTLVSDASVGIYTVALKLCEPWPMISGVIMQVTFATILADKLSGQNPALYRFRFMKILSLLTWSAIFLAGLYHVSIHWIIDLVFSSTYAEAEGIVHILVWGTLFQFWNVAQSVWDVAENLTLFTFLRALFTAVINIGLNLILIPLYAGEGAAIATVAAMALANILMNLSNKRSREFLKMELESFLFWRFLPTRKF